MATLRARLAYLETTASDKCHADHCLVVHNADCAKDREAARAKYVNEHGCEPKEWFNVYLVSSTTKQRLCPCPETAIES